MADENDKKVNKNAEPEEEIVEFEFNEDSEGKFKTSYGAGGEEELIRKLQKLKSELKVCRKEKEEYLTGWQTERAGFANYRKEESERQTRLSARVREDMLSSFLPVLDSFNMAFANREAWEKVDPAWRRGVEYIYSQMNGIFEEYGVKPIGEVGEKFDPAVHQSVDTTPTDKKDADHTVSSVVQKGYKFVDLPAQTGRVLRPARVHVYEYKATE